MSRVRGESGFTLTELLISVIIIAIGVVGFATAVGLQSTELWIGQRDTEISMLVSEELARIRALPYDSVVAGSRTEGDYELDWIVQGNNPKRVMLEITYDGSNGLRMADTVVAYVPQQ